MVRLGTACIFLAALTHSAAAETFDVTMAGSTYSPPTLTARVGDMIRFVNDDESDHQVFAPTAGHAFDLRKQPVGEAREIVMLRPGTFEVECVIHADMKLVVEVQE